MMTSLHELRAIAQQRVADERAAIEQARAAELERHRAAEQARADAEAARERAERDQRLRLEQARADAEREARLHAAATEAAERARHRAALDERRLEQEIALRRAEVARKRPTWMLAVTAVAVVAGAALAWFAIGRTRAADDAERARVQAVASAAEAKRDAEDSRVTLERLAHELDALDAKVGEAERVLRVANTDAEIRRAQQMLDDANRQRAETRRRADDAKKKHDAWVRQQGVDVTGCASTVLGCLK